MLLLKRSSMAAFTAVFCVVFIHTVSVTASYSSWKSAPLLPFRDPSLPWDARVDDLVGRMTLPEIVPQTLAGPTPAIPRLGIQPYVWSTECIRGQVSTNTTAFPQSLGLAATFR